MKEIKILDSYDCEEIGILAVPDNVDTWDIEERIKELNDDEEGYCNVEILEMVAEEFGGEFYQDYDDREKIYI